jgi:glycosyltransferase involved in cell wall biosynthesis
MPSREIKRRIDIVEQPLVSIITPVYNAQDFLEDCIKSVQGQTYQNWELLIVDDASKDGSVAIANEYANKDARINISLLKENKGAAYCRNLATQQAKGAFISFLDADDIWFPEKLDVQLTTMADEQRQVCFSSYKKIDVEGMDLGITVEALRDLTYNKQHRNNYVGNLTGIYHADSLGKILAPNIRKRQDWAVWLEAISRSDQPARGIKKPLAAYRVHQRSISANKIGLLRYNYAFYKNYMGYSSVKAVVMMGCFLKEYFVDRPKLIKKTG